MNKQDMVCRLKQAAQQAIEQAQTLVTEELPERYVLDVHLGMDDLGRMSVENLSDLIWVDGRTRRWIDIGVREVEQDKTVLRVTLAKDFMDYEELASLIRRPLVPFVILGPRFPKGWRVSDERGIPSLELSLQTHGKFVLAER